MSTSPLSSQEIRAAAETRRELGPEYDDAVVESFVARVEKVIEARVDARLADRPQARSRRIDPAKMAKRRLVLKSMAVGSVGAGIPLSFLIYEFMRYNSGTAGKLVLVWLSIAAAYAVASALLLQPWRRDRE